MLVRMSMTCHILRKKKLVKHYQDKRGLVRVQGLAKALRSSAAYPVGFGYAMAACLG